ncbi:MAG: D-glycero-alpha-D-manno-heptose-1,7-bisphosphate 7-phosphatase [Planctomycetaceae bacterium]|jgi:D-glycero-D-manno-heptose 1,7-bisphosphate phosphatase
MNAGFGHSPRNEGGSPVEEGRSTRRLVLLDRDGTLNIERHYLADPDQLELLPGVIPALRLLREHGLGLVVVTNQSGVARGLISPAQLAAVHERLHQLLGEAGIELDGVYFCPHGPQSVCHCRKPRAGMALQAARELGGTLSESFVVGDKRADIGLGQAIGATTLLVRTGYGAETERDWPGEGPRPTAIVNDLPAAAEFIVRQLADRDQASPRAA